MNRRGPAGTNREWQETAGKSLEQQGTSGSSREQQGVAERADSGKKWQGASERQ